MPVVIAISNGNHHYREIARSIPRIAFKMLSKELQTMELNKLITRLEDPFSLQNVEYRLTNYCESFYPLVESLIHWGKHHREVIKLKRLPV